MNLSCKGKGNRIKLGGVVAILLLLSITLCSCTTYSNFKEAFFPDEEAEAVQIIRIAVYEPLSGPDKSHGKLEAQGIELGHSLYPKVLGKDIVLEYGDNKSNMYAAEGVIQDLISKKPAIVLGSYGSVNSLTAVSYLEEAKIPAIAITNGNPLVTSNNPYYFRVCYTDAFEGIAIAKYAVEKMKVSKAAIMKPSGNDFANAVTLSFANKMVQLTGNNDVIGETQVYEPGATDFKEQLTKIKEAKVEVVFLPASVSDAANILKQAKEISLKAKFLGTSQWETQKLIDLAGKEAAEGVAFSTNFDSNTTLTETTATFLRLFKEKYGSDAVPDSATALGFDAYILAIDAIHRAESSADGNRVREFLQKTKQFQGASGSITFDDNGDPVKSVVIKGVHRGEIVKEYTVEPVWTTN